jgi:uncharacterized protein (TIGR02996 family)
VNYHEAFLAAIVEAPDDDTPRLVYADWLDEHGEPERAEFIRAQVRAAQPDIEERERFALERRARELFLRHGAKWMAELPAVPGVAWGKVGPFDEPLDDLQGFERGFPTWATVKDVAALGQHAQDAATATTIRSLCYTLQRPEWHEVAEATHGPGAQDVPRWRGSFLKLLRGPALRSVAALSILPDCGAELREVGARLLAENLALPGLRWLDLSNQGIGAEGVAALAASPHLSGLTGLNLQGNNLTSAGLRALTRSPHLRGLTHLDLSGADFEEGRLNHFDADGLDALGRWPAAAELRALWLCCANVEDGGMRALAEAGSFRELQKLDLAMNWLTAEGVLALASMPGIAGLRKLNLSLNSLDLAGVQELTRAAPFTRLHTLRLGAANLGPDAVGELAGAASLQELEVLVLDRNPIGDEGVAALASSRCLTRLSSLSLASLEGACPAGPLTAAGIRALGRSANLVSLGELDLSRNAMDTRKMQALREALTLPLLHRLVLQSAQVDDDGVRALAASPFARRLTELVLRDNQITAKGATWFLDRGDWPQLLRLDLRSNNLGPLATDALRRSWGDAILLD